MKGYDMCGIFGYINYGKEFCKLDIANIYSNFAKMCVKRGKHACGIAYTLDGRLAIEKAAGEITHADFVFPHDTKVLMAHCRLSLLDDYLEHGNNHPFEGKTQDGTRYAFAHNGILSDLKETRQRLFIPPTKIATDSYAAVQILDTQRKLNMQALKNTCEQLSGSYIFTILDEYNNFFICRGDVPIYLVHFKKLKLYIYMSTRDLFEKAIEATELNYVYQTSNLESHASDVNMVMIHKGEIVKITQEGERAYDTFQFKDEKSISHNWYMHEITPSKRLDKQLENLGN
ncbi:hypothetical protein LQZ18_08845 [Lachnospiraceae bacterium ZAX-1]